MNDKRACQPQCRVFCCRQECWYLSLCLRYIQLAQVIQLQQSMIRLHRCYCFSVNNRYKMNFFLHHSPSTPDQVRLDQIQLHRRYRRSRSSRQRILLDYNFLEIHHHRHFSSNQYRMHRRLRNLCCEDLLLLVPARYFACRWYTTCPMTSAVSHFAHQNYVHHLRLFSPTEMS